MKKTILIIEDDLDMQQYFRIILADLGCELLSAENGAEALAIIDSGKNIDLIILDMVMPVMDGEEFFRILRRDRRMETPVIFSSVDETRASPLKALGKLQGIFLKGRKSQELKEMILQTTGMGI